jgi:hypothetical protein
LASWEGESLTALLRRLGGNGVESSAERPYLAWLGVRRTESEKESDRGMKKVRSCRGEGWGREEGEDSLGSTLIAPRTSNGPILFFRDRMEAYIHRLPPKEIGSHWQPGQGTKHYEVSTKGKTLPIWGKSTAYLTCADFSALHQV